jgi:hypothetical protein
VRLGELGQPLALLLLGAEHEQRLAEADRLVRRQQRRQRGVVDADDRERLVVVDLRQAEAAVLLRRLHAQRAEVLQALHDVLGDPGLALDLERVDLLLEERAQARQEGLALLGRGRIEPRLRVDQVEAEVAEEELLAEARQLPVGLTGLLGDLPSLLLTDVRGCGHGRCSPRFKARIAGRQVPVWHGFVARV